MNSRAFSRRTEPVDILGIFAARHRGDVDDTMGNSRFGAKIVRTIQVQMSDLERKNPKRGWSLFQNRLTNPMVFRIGCT